MNIFTSVLLQSREEIDVRKMHLAIIFILIACVVSGNAEFDRHESQSEARLFFKQIIEASGLLPIEINVPDTLSTMWGAMNYMYQATSSYFSGSEEGASEASDQVVYDDVDESLKPINGKRRQKKVKKLKKKTNDDVELNVFDLLRFLLI
jgi:hypothetical protein